MLKSTKNIVIWQKISDSTSAELRRMVQKAACGNTQDALLALDRTTVAAEFQEKGRGRADHVWLSEPGKNLTFSIFFNYGPARRFETAGQYLLTMACSLAVCDFLKDFSIRADIKKPNDIYVGGRKICGMLIENSLKGDEMNWSIVGIGININQTVFPDSLPNPVSLVQLTGRSENIKRCLNKLLRHLSVRFDAIWSDPTGLERDYSDKIL